MNNVITYEKKCINSKLCSYRLMIFGYKNQRHLFVRRNSLVILNLGNLINFIPTFQCKSLKSNVWI